VRRLAGDPVGEDGAGGTELHAAELPAAFTAYQACLDIQRVLAATLGAAVADAPAGQHAGKQAALLFRAGGYAQQAEQAEMVLRNLTRGRGRGGNDAAHFGAGDAGQLRPTKRARRGDV